MKILNKEKGSITLFVLVAMLFFVMYLVGMYMLNANSEASQTAEVKRIKEIYEKGISNIDDVYETETQMTYNMVDGVPVPKGFTHIAGTKETGFVIKNDTDGNEFVWIPTDLVTYQTYDWGKGNAATAYSEYYTSDETENADIIEEINTSVSDHKGYYISRYEAGVTTKRTSKTETASSEMPKPIFQATSTKTPVYAYNYVNWNDAIYVTSPENLYNKETHNVNSRLINAKGWDTAVKFIETVGADADATYPTNSTGKGWYSDNKSNNPNYETGKSVGTTNVTTPNMLKNIYDMAGNLYEWTADIYTSDTYSRARRGGYYNHSGSSYPAAYRISFYYDDAYGICSFRLALYL